MSMHMYTYLGPYLKLTLKTKTMTSKSRRCSNKSCKNHKGIDGEYLNESKVKFCSNCGSKIESYNLPAEEVHDSPDIDEMFNDELTSLDSETALDGVEFYAANRIKGIPRDFFLDRHEGLHEDLLKVDREAEIKWLQKYCEPFMSKLNKAYKKVEFGWGLHTYIM
jgi:hypothetical protein